MNNPQPWWITWPPEEVAVTILPLFAYPQLSPHGYEGLIIYNIVLWCKTGRWAEPKLIFGEGNPFTDPDSRAIAEAMQVLEQARLLMRYVSGDGHYVSKIGLTRRGLEALQTNTVRQHLGLSDTPPATPQRIVDSGQPTGRP
jgi:hypothetical protein